MIFSADLKGIDSERTDHNHPLPVEDSLIIPFAQLECASNIDMIVRDRFRIPHVPVKPSRTP
jgi:hypothetical protein